MTSTASPESPESAETHAPRSVVGALGIGVSDLARSADFYTRVLGMRRLMALKLPYMDEIVVGFEGRSGSAIALMHWTDGSERDYANLPVKIVCYVPDPAALAGRIRAEGLEIVREPAPVPELGDAVVGFAKDPDGYLIEILQGRT
ncbi:lactoylglutathione lyase [Actinomadura craniellae]|uniref:Aldoketomutase n=1 Tax=Actinomadura craniellae TaxID=2231787 RepID=A0A365HDP5_9ACTN|nr:VOC family protein [Actinomadura craniellae]RAY17169.1 lactoylglutathione lyase [Actinomadura craniellae]